MLHAATSINALQILATEAVPTEEIEPGGAEALSVVIGLVVIAIGVAVHFIRRSRNTSDDDPRKRGF